MTDNFPAIRNPEMNFRAIMGRTYGTQRCQSELYYHLHFDIIKVKGEKSSDLIRKHSLLCKFLALKADDTGADPESLIYDIYQAVADMKDQLDPDRLLLIHQWTDFYKKVPDETIRRIRKEVNMDVIETTISEHKYLLIQRS